MKFVAGSNLPDDALQRLAQDMVDAHGGQARDVVNRLIDAANGDSDFAAHAKWINVSLAVLQILRPAR